MNKASAQPCAGSDAQGGGWARPCWSEAQGTPSLACLSGREHQHTQCSPQGGYLCEGMGPGRSDLAQILLRSQDKEWCLVWSCGRLQWGKEDGNPGPKCWRSPEGSKALLKGALRTWEGRQVTATQKAQKESGGTGVYSELPRLSPRSMGSGG